MPSVSVAPIAPKPLRRCQPRGENAPQPLFRRHFDAFAQYMARPRISLAKVTLEEQGGKVLFHTRYNP